MSSLSSALSYLVSISVPPIFFPSRPTPTTASCLRLIPPKGHRHSVSAAAPRDDGIPADDVKTLARFKSRHNYIRVLEVSRRCDHPFAGSRLLLLDSPGNIHSISFLLQPLTSTYLDVFATLPPIVPTGPIGVLGFGAGSAARLLLELYPRTVVHGWELDPAVIDVAREYFGLSRLESDHQDRISIHIGDALKASARGGFAGVLVDLFSRGCLVPELQDPRTWERLRKGLRRGGRLMVNVGGSCVEAEDKSRDGRAIMEETLEAMREVFGEELQVLRLGNREDDSSLALTGRMPDLDAWKAGLPKSLRCYADMWRPICG